MPDKELAPIVLFVYNRPKHTAKLLDSLKKNNLAVSSVLYVFADGAKANANFEEKERVAETRALFRSLNGFKQIHLIEKEKNQGLAASVINGVTEVINRHGKIIVLEDDLFVAPYFLEYMNQGLGVYQDAGSVYSVNAYMFPIEFKKTETFLSPLATSSWGWGTWANKWACFDQQIEYKELIQSNSYLKQRFNFSDYDYAGMLDVKSSWAIKWYYSVFIRNGLGVFPTKSLVQNIGFDGSGTHGVNSFQQPSLFDKKIEINKKDIIDLENYCKMLDFFKEKNPNILGSIFRVIKKTVTLIR
jgi:hypothetical protein